MPGAIARRVFVFGSLVVLSVGFLAPGRGLAAGASLQLEFGVDMARRGLWSEALFRFQQAEEADPGNAHVLNNLAVAYEAVGRFDDALETYRRALKADPSDRALKRNYARFIEFYQAFKPQEQQPAEAPESETPPAEAVEAETPAGEAPAQPLSADTG